MEMTTEQMQARIAELEAKVNRQNNMRLKFKVSEKGALSVYGIQRFPVTLYVDQWERLLAATPDLQAFAQENALVLQRKADKV